MEIPKTKDTIDQIRVRGEHERIITDTAVLAGELSRHQDLTSLTIDFDKGLTPLRDVGDMFTSQRQAILDAYHNNSLNKLIQSHPEILTTPVANLHKRVISGPQDQPIGHNFFVNATGFIDANCLWAKELDSLLYRRVGRRINDIVLLADMSK